MFIETHMHISLDGENASRFRQQIKENKDIAEKIIRKNIQAYKTRGIMAIRDGGDPINLSTMTRRIAKEEGVIYKTPIHAIYKKGNYGKFIGIPIQDMGDFKEVIFEIEKYQPDFIKIPLTGMMNFDVYGDIGEIAFSQDELNYIVKYAKEKNYPVMVHVNSRTGIQRAIKAGVNTIEHGYFMKEEEMYAIKEADIIWVPTLAPLGNIIYSEDDRYRDQFKTIQKIFNEQCLAVKRAHEIGVKLAIGSDAGAYKVLHGKGFFDEFTYMKNVGIENDELVELAYRNGCEALQMTDEEVEFMQSNFIKKA